VCMEQNNYKFSGHRGSSSGSNHCLKHTEGQCFQVTTETSKSRCYSTSAVLQTSLPRTNGHEAQNLHIPELWGAQWQFVACCIRSTSQEEAARKVLLNSMHMSTTTAPFGHWTVQRLVTGVTAALCMEQCCSNLNVHGAVCMEQSARRSGVRGASMEQSALGGVHMEQHAWSRGLGAVCA
jgi:hypothetical protein